MDGRHLPTPTESRPPPGLRERKKERTRQALRDSALRLFDERGFDAVTVDDISGEVDVSHRTFYRYFSSKEEIVLGPRSDLLERWVGAIGRRPASEPVLAAIRTAAIEIASSVEPEIADRRRVSVLEATPSLKARASERLAAWEETLAPVVASRLGVDVEADLRPRLIAGCMIVALRVAQSKWLTGEDGDLSAVVAEALDLLARDFGTRGPAVPATVEPATP